MKENNGSNYVAVTEISGDEVTQEQIERLCNRYYWAAQYCLNKDVIEVACGTGQGAGYLSKLANSFEAGDYSSEILEIARKYYGNRLKFQQFDAMEMPFAENSKDVIILFEAIYYIPDASRFFQECVRILRPGGKLLIATANKDLFDFNPSPHSHEYYGVEELKKMIADYGFGSRFFGDTSVKTVSLRQKILRPIKRIVINLNLFPKTSSGKKWLKAIVFGKLRKMPYEIAPPLLHAEVERISSEIESSAKQGNEIVSTTFVQPMEISSDKADIGHKVILCEATLKHE